jgi:hypothetical protein
LLVEQVLDARQDLQRFSLLYEAFAEGMSERKEREGAVHVCRMRNAVTRSYTATLKALALIRKAAPAVTVKLTKTVNVTRGERKAGPIVDRLAPPCGN